MIEQKKHWLQGVDWESVLNLNRTLCQAQKQDSAINAKAHAKAQEFWLRATQKPMTMIEAIETCHKAFSFAPFTFNNGNTFAGVARTLIEEYLRNTPAVESQIIRSTVSHYVAGTIRRQELEQVLIQLAPLLSKPAPSPTPALRASDTTTIAASALNARPMTSG